MLLELRIRNFAIIEALDLTFSKGLNILTGETGAGKSIILSAVQLLLGDKATDELVRGSEEEANVEALFDISGNWEAKERFKERGQRLHGAGEEDSLLIRRMISRSGRGRVFINGSLATLGMLSEIGEVLLSIYGQHEHQSLQRVETHSDILDEFGGLSELREEFQKHFQKFTALSEEVERIRAEKERRAKEHELMAFQSREIEKSGIQPEEEKLLREERQILTHAEKLMNFANTSEAILYGDEGSAIERIQAILNQGREMMAIDSSLSQLLGTLENNSIQLEEIALGLRDYSKRIEFNPTRMEEIENRLDEIDRLKRKYGPTIEEILLFKERIEKTLKTFNSDEERLSEIEAVLAPLQGEVNVLAKKLSGERRKVALELKIHRKRIRVLRDEEDHF